MTRALIYARQSVERDDGDKSLSIESQLAALRARCQAEGWRIVGEEREAGLRGWMDESERPALARGIERATAGDYDILLVWDMSRLARSVRLQEEWVYRLARAGVDIISHTEPHASDDMIRVIFGAIHQRQTKILSANMCRVFAERARRGLPHGRAPYGYRRDDAGKLTPCDDQAHTIHELFHRFCAGAGTAELAAWLTERGLPTHSGRRTWAATTVRTILLNPAYTGAIDAGGGRVEAAHPAIIDPLTWRRAQDRLANYVWTRRKAGGSWLEGHLEHACGARMYYRQQPTRESTHPAFICAAAQHAAACPVRPRRCAVAHAETATWDLVRHALTELHPVERVVRRLQRADAALAPRLRSERHRLIERQRALTGERELAEDLYLRGRRDHAWFDAIDLRVEADLAALTARLAELPAAIDLDAAADRHAALRELAGSLDLIQPADRGALLAALGTAVVQPGTNRRPPLAIRWRSEIAPFVREFAPINDSRG